MKAIVVFVLLLVLFVIIFLQFNQATNGKSVVQAQSDSEVSRQLPIRLRIPSINVNATIESVGLTDKRVIEVPKDSLNVGWYKLGILPGGVGSAVIDGHVDRENGEAGVFANLYKLKPGDKIYVENQDGKIITFVVKKSQTFDPGLADAVFSLSEGTHLNLITCEGVWDGVKKSYSKRLVVFTDLLQI